MRVRILSGSQTGQIVDVGPEGAIMLSNGFAELAPIDTPQPGAALAPPEPDQTVAPAVAEAEGGSLAEPDESDDVSKDPEEPAGIPAARVRRPRTQKAALASRRKRR